MENADCIFREEGDFLKCIFKHNYDIGTYIKKNYAFL